MTTIYDASDFASTHGKNPKGYGAWAFEASVHDGQGAWSQLAGTKWITANYTQAKREAREHFKREASTIGAARELVIRLLP